MAAGSLFPDGSFTHLELSPNCKSQVKKTISQPFSFAFLHIVMNCTCQSSHKGRWERPCTKQHSKFIISGEILENIVLDRQQLFEHMVNLTQNIFFCNLMYLPDVAASISELNVKIKLLRDYEAI